MNTEERAAHLAEAINQFPYLGETGATDLLALISAELGDPQVLETFRWHGPHLSRAVAPHTILHIVSGNTPAAGLQSLIRGLLLGSHNLCKLPAAGLPDLIQFRELLPPELASRVELATHLPAEWLERADALVVFGSDETVREFRSMARADQAFVGHGHKLSLGLIFHDPHFVSVRGAARDASLFDQLGCLSPHVFYVAEDPLTYAIKLADEMERFDAKEPRRTLSISEANAIRNRRAELAFRAANDKHLTVMQSAGSTAWTVVFDPTPGFPRSPLNRFIFVKPLPADLAVELAPVRRHLGAIGMWPASIENARKLTGFGANRLCPIGHMQQPPWTWHQDGQPALTALVRWVDFEAAS
jgi:hypothetical protein